MPSSKHDLSQEDIKFMTNWASLIQSLTEESSQNQLAKRLGVASTTVKYWREGQNILPDFIMVSRVARLIGKSPEDLLRQLFERDDEQAPASVYTSSEVINQMKLLKEKLDTQIKSKTKNMLGLSDDKLEKVFKEIVKDKHYCLKDYNDKSAYEILHEIDFLLTVLKTKVVD